APFFGTDAKLHFHRQAGILALLIVLAHPVILILANRAYLEFFDPRVNFLRAVFLVVASLAVVLLVVLSQWRLSLGLQYESWRLSHAALAVIALVIGLVHALQVGHYVTGIPKQAFWVAASLAVLATLVY